MKKDTIRNSKLNQSNAKPAIHADEEDTKWFEQFSDMPGIDNDYSQNELKVLKDRMLTAIKAKINELD